MNPSCILTGHFVPPPGHDPWTGLRHDYSPTENFQQQWIQWNRSCFGANSASRILNPEGKIRDIVNNYRYLNFSVSPTLLDELSRSSPNVYRRFREADADSVARLGHGNAMARPWKEVILPLLSPERAALQIDWGIAAFAHHFGRQPEGFCLPHDAVNAAVLDLLVERGLKFLLLSGRQAEGLMSLGSGSWTSLGGAPAPGDRAFQIDRPEGRIAVFFPDEGLSKGLLQDRLLTDATRLEGAIRHALLPTGFIHLSARGEAFGIDEPFADMCLAALWEKLGGASPIECVNYATMLENRPPKELVKLKRGEDELGSSADCPHGVGRWHRDCGCRSSASHQRWKSPLWTTMQDWSQRLTQEALERTLTKGVDEPTLVAALPRLFLGVEEPRPWARGVLGRTEAGAEDQLLRAARCYLWAQGSFLENLWDGDDPASTGARGGLLSALRAFDFSGTHTIEGFLGSLEPITINDGRTLAAYVSQELLRRRHDPRFAAALLLLDRLLRPRARYEDSLGPLTVTEFTRSRHEIDEGVYRYLGLIRLLDGESDSEIEFEYLLLEDHREGVSLYLKEAESTDKPQAFDLQLLPVGERTEIVHLMGNDLESNLASETQAIFPLLRKSLVYARLLDVPPLPMARSLMELAVTRKILSLTEGSEVPEPEVLEVLEEELTFSRDFDLKLDSQRLNGRFSRWLAKALSHPEDFTSELVVKAVETLLAALGRWGFAPELTVAQALVFEALRDRAPRLLASLESGRVEALQELKRLIRLGTLLWIDTSMVKNRLLEL